jgi:hypothetical protein
MLPFSLAKCCKKAADLKAYHEYNCISTTHIEVEMAIINEKQDIEATMSDEDILEIVLNAEQEMIEAMEDAIAGHINPLIIKGPPGVGKSQLVEEMTILAGIISTDFISSDFSPPTSGPAYPYQLDYLQTQKGALMRGADYSVWAFVADLYANRETGLICLDDNDTILKDKNFVALLMKATEQRAVKPISYPKANSTHELQMYGVKSSFNVETPIIILTNLDMEEQIRLANEKQNDGRGMKKDYISRWEALKSRGKYIDLQMNSPRSIRVYCENKIRNVNMLTNSAWLEKTCGRSLTEEEQEVALKWIRKNQSKLKDPLDLRSYNKLASIMLRRPNWEKSAEVSLFK